ncbi:hypothetical protein BGZ96_009632 [Linnemannia gamsii]|uniref:Uncharacterized protein n=1 Tax=Linnemannia gamsii TaxID=64522 RepID=A0ABQ7JW19_9FUNG|nr:hypothetical protein BGZ96_009632 [Linnemannia gamsii]
MYKCEIGKKPKYSGLCGKQGCVPGFNRTAEDGSTITGPLNDTCLDTVSAGLPTASVDMDSSELRSGSDHAVHMYWYRRRALFTITLRRRMYGYDEKPHMSRLQGQDPGSTDCEKNLTMFKNDVDTTELGWTAGYLQLHLNMTLNDLKRLKEDSTKVPSTLESQLAKFEQAVTELELCSSANVTDCPGVVETYDKNTAEAIKLLKSSPLPKEEVAIVQAVVAKLKGVIDSNDQDDLDEASEDLNRILVKAKLDPSLGAAVTGPLELIIITARDTLDCKSGYKPITKDLEDLCSAYMRRLQGETAKIAGALEEVFKINDLLGSLPLSKSIAPTLMTINGALTTRGEDLGNATRSLQSSLLPIKDVIEQSPSYKGPKATAVIKMIDDSKKISDKVTACAAPGVDDCDGKMRLARAFGLSASTAVTKTTNEVDSPSVSFFATAEEVKDKLKDLNNLLNRKTPADMTGVCDAVKSSAAAFKKMKGLDPWRLNR